MLFLGDYGVGFQHRSDSLQSPAMRIARDTALARSAIDRSTQQAGMFASKTAYQLVYGRPAYRLMGKSRAPGGRAAPNMCRSL